MCGSVGASTSATVRPARSPSASASPSSLASKKSWKPEADAEARSAGANPVAQRLEQAALAQVDHGRRGGADTRNDDRVDAGQSRRFVGHDDLGPDRRQGPGDADHVRRAVVQDGDPDRRRLIRATPSWRRDPDVADRRRTAARSARPSALKAASARWWSLRPRPSDVERHAAGAGERLEDVLDQLQRQLAGALALERQIDDRVRAAAHVHDRRRDRLVHRHGGVAEAGDPGAIAESLGQGGAEDQRHVLDGVVLVD